MEASNDSESSSESNRLIREFNPAVISVVLTAEVVKNPISVDNEDKLWPGFRREALEGPDLPMQNNPPSTEETAAGLEPVQSLQTQRQTELETASPPAEKAALAPA